MVHYWRNINGLFGIYPPAIGNDKILYAIATGWQWQRFGTERP